MFLFSSFFHLEGFKSLQINNLNFLNFLFFFIFAHSLERGAKSFIMTNMNAKNVIREFEFYASVAEEDHIRILLCSN